MNTDLINLPWEVQVALASGYAAYYIANHGNRTHHQAIDVAFSTLVFGLFASVFYALLLVTFGIYFAGLGAFILTTLVGAIWRKFGSAFFRWVLRGARISFANDDPSALATIGTETSVDLEQISITLNSGSKLSCDDTTKFSNYPFGPCLLGPKGDVALYVTHEITPDGKEKPQTNVISSAYGARLTYVPSQQIERINLRFKKK